MPISVSELTMPKLSGCLGRRRRSMRRATVDFVHRGCCSCRVDRTHGELKRLPRAEEALKRRERNDRVSSCDWPKIDLSLRPDADDPKVRSGERDLLADGIDGAEEAVRGVEAENRDARVRCRIPPG